jgi:serine/threonine-protein kinase
MDGPSSPAGTALPGVMGRYVPIARIGSGGMAEIYLAVARGPAGWTKLVVLKRARSAEDPSQVQMFLDEARLAARLAHPNLAHTYEVSEVADKHFIAMEYLEGQPLQALTTRVPEGLPDDVAAYVISQTLRGLHHAHELVDFDGLPMGVVHRDVSPQNIHLSYSGEVKLLDFGIAKTRLNSARTETGMLKGKVRYMAPEQFGDRDVDRRADVYACGVVLWEMLARRPLHTGELGQLMHRIVNDDAPRLSSVREDVPAELDAVVARALSREREERYTTALAMCDALEVFLRTRGYTAPDRRLASLMGSTFASSREEIRRKIREFVEKAPDPDAPAPPSAVPAPGELPLLGLGEAQGSTTNAGRVSRSVGAGVTASVAASPGVDPGTRTRPWTPWVAVASAVVVVAMVSRATLRSAPPAVVASPPAAAADAAVGGMSTGPAAIPPPPAPVPVASAASAASAAPASAAAPSPGPASPAASVVRRRGPPKGPSAPAPRRVKIRVLDDSDSP